MKMNLNKIVYTVKMILESEENINARMLGLAKNMGYFYHNNGMACHMLDQIMPLFENKPHLKKPLLIVIKDITVATEKTVVIEGVATLQWCNVGSKGAKSAARNAFKRLQDLPITSIKQYTKANDKKNTSLASEEKKLIALKDELTAVKYALSNYVTDGSQLSEIIDNLTSELTQAKLLNKTKDINEIQQKITAYKKDLAEVNKKITRTRKLKNTTDKQIDIQEKKCAALKADTLEQKSSDDKTPVQLLAELEKKEKRSLDTLIATQTAGNTLRSELDLPAKPTYSDIATSDDLKDLQAKKIYNKIINDLKTEQANLLEKIENKDLVIQNNADSVKTLSEVRLAKVEIENNLTAMQLVLNKSIALINNIEKLNKGNTKASQATLKLINDSKKA